MTRIARLLLLRCVQEVSRVIGMVPANGWTALINLISHLNLAPFVVEPLRLALGDASLQSLPFSMMGVG